MSKIHFLLPIGLIALSVSDFAYASGSSLELTIYGDGRTLVDDTRQITYTSGTQSISLPGVSSAILPQSVTVRSDNIEILEQNFDFDLLTPAKLMEKAVGEYVQIVRINPATGAEEKRSAKVLSVNNGTVIEVDGKIEVLRADQVPTRVIFDNVPENLRAEPTLSLTLNTLQAGSRPLGLSYLTSGINWEADYVMSFDEATKQMDIQGWATLENLTQTRFEDAELSVIVGYVGNLYDQGRYRGYNQNQSEYSTFYHQQRNRLQGIYNQRRAALRKSGTEASSQERVGDNLIYRLPQKTTLAAKQKKQITLVEANNVAANKVYEFYNGGFSSSDTPRSVESRISFSNSRAKGLGEALPAGTIRVYSKDNRGKSQFIGEENIGHIAGGSDINLKIGEAFDITAKPTLVKSNNLDKTTTEFEMRFDLNNASSNDVTVRLYQSLSGYRNDYKFLSESQTGNQPHDYRRYWDVDIPAQGSSKLTFKVRQKRK